MTKRRLRSRLLSALVSASVALLLWQLLRPRLLGLAPSSLIFPIHETPAQRLLLSSISATSLCIGGLFAPRRYYRTAPVVACCTYMLFMGYRQNILHRDWWKWWERGYLERAGELLLLGLCVGLAVDGLRWVVRIRRERRQRAALTALYPNQAEAPSS